MLPVLEALAAALAVGVIGAVATLLVARRSLRAAAVLGPVTVVLAMGAGLLVGVQLMLLDAGVPLLILAVTAPIALAVGILISVRTQRQVAAATAELERERLERQAERSRRELIAGMSHDLRTPLAGIRAMAEALQDGVAPDPARYHRAIIAEANRTSGMVDDLLALASLSAGTRTAANEVVSLGDLLSDLVAHLEPLARRREVTVVGSAAGPVEVRGDAGLLARAVQNLLVNALTYTRSGTTVRAQARVVAGPSGERRAEVTVQDACGGIPEAELPRLFDTGWRGDAARTPGAAVGSGLGLPIVAMIAELHGGAVSIRNVGPGCCARLDLPAA